MGVHSTSPLLLRILEEEKKGKPFCFYLTSHTLKKVSTPTQTPPFLFLTLLSPKGLKLKGATAHVLSLLPSWLVKGKREKEENNLNPSRRGTLS